MSDGEPGCGLMCIIAGIITVLAEIGIVNAVGWSGLWWTPLTFLGCLLLTFVLITTAGYK